MIELDCPGCGHALRIKNKFAGLKGKCKYCETSFHVPNDIVVTPDGEHPEVGTGDEILTSNESGHIEKRSRIRVDTVPLVDPGADGVGALRYGQRGGGLGVPLLISSAIVVILFGAAFWFMGDVEEQSTYIDDALVGAMTRYSSVGLGGVDVAVFGDGAFERIDSVVLADGPLSKISKDGLVSFELVMDGEYNDVVSDYQLSLTELGWDFVISDSGDGTELYGEFEGRDVSLSIRGEEDGVRVVFVTVKD